MNKAMLFFMLLSVASQAQNWPAPPDGHDWIAVQKSPIGANGEYTLETRGGVPTWELDTLSLATIVSGYSGRGYYQFMGEVMKDAEGWTNDVLDWPPGLFPPEFLYNVKNRFMYSYTSQPGFCSCDCGGGIDTIIFLEGFGFWWDNPGKPGNIWGINDGYVVTVPWFHIWRQIPCPPAAPWYGKDPLFFTDSLYQDLPDGAVVSGQSPLYLRAHTSVPVAQLQITLKVDSPGAQDFDTFMTYIDTLEEWHLKAPPACSLGLKSYSTVKAYTHHPSTDSTWDEDELAVALPKIFTMVDTTLIDTVFIRSDSMKVAKDLKVGLTFVGDKTAMLVDPIADSLVACAGYKYRSRWIANENLPSLDSIYYRQFPRIDSLYKWWNDSTAKCLYTFKRDSLYVVGGKLTILSKGKLKPIKDECDSLMAIDNSFKATTDSVISVGLDSIKTKLILIDKDPANSLFLDSLQYDIIKAIAWIEYAGSNDNLHHCHDPYNPHYNNYWDYVYSAGDTCVDSLTPCENRLSTATGTMQMLRGTWETAFDSAGYIPSGYHIARWDSLAWNWKINIQNGKFIYFRDNFYRINRATNPQRSWDSLCTLCNPADTIPVYPNKEDLSTYGYKYGFYGMDSLTTKNWKSVMTSPEAYYVRGVRRNKYERPW